MAERSADELLHAAVVGRQLRAPERDERRIDVRLRPEDGAGHCVEARALGGELDEHRHRAVLLRPGLREEPVGHLPLHHHAPEPDVRQAVDALDDERRRDVVREVRNELRRVLRELDPERVPEDDLDVPGKVAQRGLERAVGSMCGEEKQ